MKHELAAVYFDKFDRSNVNDYFIQLIIMKDLPVTEKKERKP